MFFFFFFFLSLFNTISSIHQRQAARIYTVYIRRFIQLLFYKTLVSHSNQCLISTLRINTHLFIYFTASRYIGTMIESPHKPIDGDTTRTVTEEELYLKFREWPRPQYPFPDLVSPYNQFPPANRSSYRIVDFEKTALFLV